MNIQILSYSPATLYSHRRLLEEASHLKWQLEFLNPDNFPRPGKMADIYLVRIGNLNYLEAFQKFQQHPQLPYLNTLESFQLARNKWQTYELFKESLPMPTSSLFARPYPCLLKIAESSQGRGVYLLQNEKGLVDLQSELQGQKFFFQDYVSEAKGHDYRIMMIQDSYVGAIERHNDKTFKANIHQGGSASAWEAPAELISICQGIMKTLGLHYAGLDFIKNSQNDFLFIEANPSPGFEAFEQATQINFARRLLESLHDKT